MKKYNDILADERPEFKAANYGFDALSNTELLSMVINRGAGTAESLSQARQLMNMADNNLSNLAKLSMDEMQVVQGIGDCKALAVLAALELGNCHKKKTLHIPLQSAVAIASERRAVGGILTARHALFCSNFSKIHDFQQVGKNDRGKFVQNAQILQSIAIDCPLENGYLCQFP